MCEPRETIIPVIESKEPKILKVEPKAVFKYFEDICEIPRGSGNELEISNYLVKWCKDPSRVNRLQCRKDSANNVLITKKATDGYENYPTVILQGHIDIVCAAKEGVVVDFLTHKVEPELYHYGEKQILCCRSKDNLTSLGADNGIAVAMMMELLDSEGYIKHPALECIFTTDEERGMTGAAAFDVSDLNGKIFINVDSEEEGFFCLSCAGGIRTVYRLPVQKTFVPIDFTALSVTIKGLKGGHSGILIHEEHGNANLLSARLLNLLMERYDIFLYDFNGGAADNAIAPSAEMKIFVSKHQQDEIKSFINKYLETLRQEFKCTDPDVTIVVSNIETNATSVLTKETAKKLVHSLLQLPNGVLNMTIDENQKRVMSIGDTPLVETSANIGIVKLVNGSFEIISALRSARASRKEDMVARTRMVAEQNGASLYTMGDYPSWAYPSKTRVFELIEDVFKNLNKEEQQKEESVRINYGEPKKYAIHAGLECGYFAQHFGEGVCDIISMGPNLYNVHTPSERLEIASTQRVWTVLLRILENIGKYNTK